MTSWRRHEVAHFLHRKHLLPVRLLNWLCNRLDTALGLYDDDQLERAAVSRQWAEDWDSREDGVYDA